MAGLVDDLKESAKGYPRGVNLFEGPMKEANPELNEGCNTMTRL